MQTKTFKGSKDFAITDFKSAEENGVVRISGYANNKHIADRYGDIPTEYNRPYVYDLEEFKRNPVLLMDHCSSVRNLVGSVTNIYEDERGLYFEAELSQSDLPEVKHARQLIREGHLKTVSIGGMWSFENPDNTNQLTLAKIFEISLVPVPADTYAVFAQEKAAASKAKPNPPDYKALEGKLTVFEMKQKLAKFDAKLKQPEQGQGATK
ncbi:MAG: HK97 family phage prohead protease [Elusimicrobia bacterium]|nr:HK97 family phage prohead protease [Elusimicrobiota bacterium]